MKIRNLLLVFAAAPVAACASIISGSDQTINVTSYPEDGADCVLESPTGEKWAVTTPGSVHLKKTKHDLTATCTKGNEMGGKTVVASDVEPWVFGNLIFGGLIGAGVDWATGAIHKYPETLNVTMAPVAVKPQPVSEKLEEGEPQS